MSPAADKKTTTSEAKTADSSITPDSPPPLMPISGETDYRSESSGNRTLMLAVYFVLALAVAVLVVFGGRWVYHKVKHNDNVAVAPAGNKTPTNSAATSAPQKTQPTNGSGTNNNQSNNSSSSNKPSQSTSGSTQLPNNGPGDVVSIFIGTAVIVGGLHYIYSLRRA